MQLKTSLFVNPAKSNSDVLVELVYLVKKQVMTMRITKVLPIGISIALALMGIVPSAFAQSADWNLTINFINVPYGTKGKGK